MDQPEQQHKQLLAQQSDEQVAVLARERNPEFFGDLVLRYQDRLVRFCRSIVWDDEAARDVAQVAFEKAFVALNAYNARKPFKPWLFGIARNEAFSHLRRTRARPSVPFSALQPRARDDEAARPELDVADERPSPAEALEASDQASRLRDALRQLDPRYRAALTLFYLEDMAYADVARSLGLPLNTVRTHLRRGKQALAELLEQAETERRNFSARRRVAQASP